MVLKAHVNHHECVHFTLTMQGDETGQCTLYTSKNKQWRIGFIGNNHQISSYLRKQVWNCQRVRATHGVDFV